MTRAAHVAASVAVAILTLNGCVADDEDEATDDEATVDDDLSLAPSPVIQHVFVIVMENHADSSIYGNTASAPYIQTLLAAYGHAVNFVDTLPAAPSEPHYVWMEAGTNAFSDHTFTDDSDPSSSNTTTSTRHLTTQIRDAGKTWTSYQESIDSTTGACPIASSGNYVAKHDPTVFFKDVTGSPPSKNNAYCVAHHKALPALATDMANNTVADYVFITPNECNDMHANLCWGFWDPIKQGDDWLSQNVPAIITYITAHEGALFIVWDEPEGTTGNIPFIAIGPHVKPGYVSTVSYTHSSLVKTVEQILHLPVLAKVAQARPFRPFFKAGFYP